MKDEYIEKTLFDVISEVAIEAVNKDEELIDKIVNKVIERIKNDIERL